MFKTKKELVFIILAGYIQCSNREIGGKLIQIGPFVMSIGTMAYCFLDYRFNQ
jgi:membrane protein CcdC involved in cytochrome C biogenesis